MVKLSQVSENTGRIAFLYVNVLRVFSKKTIVIQEIDGDRRRDICFSCQSGGKYDIKIGKLTFKFQHF